MFNPSKLKGAIVENGTTQETVAEAIGMNRSTFYRKMKSGKFTIGEAKRIANEVPLSDELAIEIFFGNKVALTRQQKGVNDLQEITLSKKQQEIYDSVYWDSKAPEMMDIGFYVLVLHENMPPRTQMTSAEQMFHTLFPTLEQQVVFGTGKGGYKKYGSRKYTADFYDPKTKIDYEIDGPEHKYKIHNLKDQIRDIALWQIHRVQVVRYTNEQVKQMVKRRIVEVFPNDKGL